MFRNIILALALGGCYAAPALAEEVMTREKCQEHYVTTVEPAITYRELGASPEAAFFRMVMYHGVPEDVAARIVNKVYYGFPVFDKAEITADFMNWCYSKVGEAL